MSEDVSKFLEQVRELGDRRVEEDEARSRELEAKILADRKERQARRAGTITYSLKHALNQSIVSGSACFVFFGCPRPSPVHPPLYWHREVAI